MPDFRTTPWYLPGVPKGFFMMLLLMLMYDIFLGKISRKSFCPMILGSPIVSHFLAILRDVSDFPFFSRSEQLGILAHCGFVLNLVGKFCGENKNSDRNISFRVIRNTLTHIVRRTLGDPKILSSIEKSIAAIMGYPLMPHKPYIRVPVDLSYWTRKTLWENLALIKSLSDPHEKILNMISVGFSFNACQGRRYQSIYIMVIFRRLFAMRNKLFVLLCDLSDRYREYCEERRSQDYLDDFRVRFKMRYKNLRKNPDFPIFTHYMTCISNMCLAQEQLNISMFDRCLIFIIFFSQDMSDARELGLFSRIFAEKSLEIVFRLLDENPGDLEIERQLIQSYLKYPLSLRAKGSSCGMDVFNMLKWLHSFDPVPEEQCQSLISMSNEVIYDDPLKNKSKMARLLLILFKFISFVKSNDEYLPFICEWFVFMKDNEMSKCPTLALFLDLQRWRESHVFHDVLSYFCKFAISSISYSEMTERTFLSFFEMIVRVTSHEQFMHRLQRLVKITRVDVEYIIQRLNDCNISDLLVQIMPFRKTSCLHCYEILDKDEGYDEDHGGICFKCQSRCECEEESWKRVDDWDQEHPIW